MDVCEKIKKINKKFIYSWVLYPIMKKKEVYSKEEAEEAEARREETKRFKEKYLKCERCGSKAVVYRVKTNMMRCLTCGFEWNAPEEGEI